MTVASAKALALGIACAIVAGLARVAAAMPPVSLTLQTRPLGRAPPAARARPPVAPRFAWHLPRGFPVPAVPADNPMSLAKVALGQKLFYDTTLSVTGRYSCGSCHDPARSFTDGRRLAIGATGETLRHNAMALVNVAYDIAFGWTEPAPRSLEAQMLEPMLNQHPVELGLKGRERTTVARLGRDASYRREFATAFPDEHPALTFRNIVMAIACFERTLISGDSPFDHYVFGDQLDALTPAAKRGMALFFSKRLGCASCHSGFNFDGNWRDAQGETGPASFANDGTSREPIRVPTLRNLRYTAPYMHDGRYATLSEVIDHYVEVGHEPDSNHGGVRDPRLRRFTLSRGERQDLVAFVESLSDPAFVRRYAEPHSHTLAGSEPLHSER